MKYSPMVDSNLSQNQNAQNLLKFILVDISNMQISIYMSKIIFIKYLSLVRLKFVFDLIMLRSYLNSVHLIF